MTVIVICHVGAGCQLHMLKMIHSSTGLYLGMISSQAKYLQHFDKLPQHTYGM